MCVRERENYIKFIDLDKYSVMHMYMYNLGDVFKHCYFLTFFVLVSSRVHESNLQSSVNNNMPFILPFQSHFNILPLLNKTCNTHFIPPGSTLLICCTRLRHLAQRGHEREGAEGRSLSMTVVNGKIQISGSSLPPVLTPRLLPQRTVPSSF